MPEPLSAYRPIGGGLRKWQWSIKSRCWIQAGNHFPHIAALSFVIPSEADLSRRAVEGSAVQRTFRGNVLLKSVAEWGHEPLLKDGTSFLLGGGTELLQQRNQLLNFKRL